MSRERGNYRLGTLLVMRGLKHLSDAEESYRDKNLKLAVQQLWCARDAFNQSSSEDSKVYTKRVQARLDAIQKELRDDLQKET